MSRLARQRGNKAELQAAHWLTSWTGKEFHRTPRSGGLRWQKDKRIRGDIVPPEGMDFPFTVEVKMRTPKVNKKSKKVFDRYNIGDILIKGQDSLIMRQWQEQCLPDADAVGKHALMLFRNASMPAHMFWVMMEYDIGYHIQNAFRVKGNEINVDMFLNQYWGIAITTTEELSYLDYDKVVSLVKTVC